jgi:hypothetical protein
VINFVQKLKWGSIITMALVASGCSSVRDNFDTRKNVGPCPITASLYDASRKVQIEGDVSYPNVGFTGEEIGVSGFCRYVDADPIEMELDIEFALGRGPAADGLTHDYSYFVAVTRRNQAVIEKEVFPLSVTFPEGEDRVIVNEKIDKIVIPRANETISGVNFEIFVGFDLTDKELEYNRSGQRFRVNAGQN